MQNMLPKAEKGGILLEDLFEDIEMIISERMGQPIKKLELNEEYKRSNKKFDDKFEEMYQEIGKKIGELHLLICMKSNILHYFV